MSLTKHFVVSEYESVISDTEVYLGNCLVGYRGLRITVLTCWQQNIVSSQSSNISYPNRTAKAGSTNCRERRINGWVTGCLSEGTDNNVAGALNG